MEIRRLRHFMAVITHGSFTAAEPEPGRTVVLVGRAPRPRNSAAEALLGRLAGGGPA
ncbi:MAG TPA: hypothetical protein VIS09_19720 [Streptomyces sp.]